MLVFFNIVIYFVTDIGTDFFWMKYFIPLLFIILNRVQEREKEKENKSSFQPMPCEKEC